MPVRISARASDGVRSSRCSSNSSRLSRPICPGGGRATASTFAPIRWLTSRLGWKSPSTRASGAGTPPPLVMAGLMVRPLPRSKSGRLVSRPAWLVCVISYCRFGDAQRSVSSRRWILLWILNCHSCRPGLNASVRIGMRISALHPVVNLAVAASQMPSQSELMSSPPGLIRRARARRCQRSLDRIRLCRRSSIASADCHAVSVSCPSMRFIVSERTASSIR